MSASLALPDFPMDDYSDAVGSLTERDTVPTFDGGQIQRPPSRKLVIRFRGGPEPIWLEAVKVQLDRILRLEDGWDSYGGRAIRLEVVRGMIELLARLGSNIRPPAVFPTANGGIQLEWNTDAGSLEIEFEGEDRISFFAEETGGVEVEKEGISQAVFLTDFYQKIDHLVPRA